MTLKIDWLIDCVYLAFSIALSYLAIACQVHHNMTYQSRCLLGMGVACKISVKFDQSRSCDLIWLYTNKVKMWVAMSICHWLDKCHNLGTPSLTPPLRYMQSNPYNYNLWSARLWHCVQHGILSQNHHLVQPIRTPQCTTLSGTHNNNSLLAVSLVSSAPIVQSVKICIFHRW